MAVLDGLAGIGAEVRVNDEPLIEYDDDEEYKPQEDIPEHRRAKTVSRYIESQTDQEFTINLSIQKPYEFDCEGIQFQIQVDGIRAVNVHISRSEYRPHKGFHYAGRGFVSADIVQLTKTIQSFKFSKLETTSDDSKLAQLKEDSERVRGIGEIIVKVYRTSKAIKRARTSHQKNIATRVSTPVHEKALKGEAKSHSISRGEETTVKVSPWCVSADYLDGKKFPLAVFRFRYRSKEALKQLLILERTPEPESVSPEPSFMHALDPEQQREAETYMKRLKSQQNSRVAIKRERDGNEIAGTSKRARKSGAKIMMIDLTNDSDDDEVQALER